MQLEKTLLYLNVVNIGFLLSFWVIMLNEQDLLKKYGDIIKEEINVKDVEIYQSDKPITKIFKPLWGQLSVKFWKDTWQIIANWKQWNVREIDGWIEVFDNDGNTRKLDESDYEVVYEWLDWTDTTVEWNTIVKLDLEITDELKREWTAREISRFLNQMRKDADFSVDARVNMHYQSDSEDMKNIVKEFSEFLKEEALIINISEWNCDSDTRSDTFESENGKVTFWLTVA